MYWNQYYECMPREQLAEIQLERLKKIVTTVYQVVPFIITNLRI